MRTNPLDERVARDGARGHTENHRFGVIQICVQFESVQHEKDFERGMTNTLVAINERMIQNQREPERGSFGFECRMQLGAVEGRASLRNGGFERTQVPNGKRAAANGDDASVEF